MVELVRAGRDPNDLAREVEPSRQTIQNLLAEADRGESPPRGQAADGRSRADGNQAQRTRSAAAREPAVEVGARYPLSCDGPVRAGDRSLAVGVFRLMSAH